MIEEGKLRVKWRFSPVGGITLVVLLFTSGIAVAQNLLINPSFELPGIGKRLRIGQRSKVGDVETMEARE